MHRRAHRMMHTMPSKSCQWIACLLVLVVALAPLLPVAGGFSSSPPVAIPGDLHGQAVMVDSAPGECCAHCNPAICLDGHACCGLHCISPAATACNISSLQAPLYHLFLLARITMSRPGLQGIHAIYRPPWS